MSNPSKIHRSLAVWSAKYEVPNVLFAFLLLVLAYCSRTVMKGFLTDQTRLRTFVLKEDVLMVIAILIVNCNDVACTAYYAENPPFESFRGGFLFFFSGKLADHLVYFKI